MDKDFSLGYASASANFEPAVVLSHRALRDGSSRAAFLAVNCQATIPWSLRDKTLSRHGPQNRLHTTEQSRGRGRRREGKPDTPFSEQNRKPESHSPGASET